jgi:glutaminase
MDTWTQLSNRLLEKNHIKIPIEKRFFLTFVEDDDTTIQKQKIIDHLISQGFLEDDPRVQQLYRNFKVLVKTNSVNYDEFKYCIANHICILKKIFRYECIIPRFPPFCNQIRSLYDESFSCLSGKNADYIPQLSRVNPDQYGISICTIDGQRHNIGDTSVEFSVQSCCKPINYAIALENLGEEHVHTYVGREPSGQSFNELLLNKIGKPHNPLINSGAIMTTSLLYPDKDLAERFESIINVWTKLCGNLYKVGFNNPVYLSEKKTADRNYALAHFMNETNENKPIGFPPQTNLNETLELYFQCCSIEVTTEILSIVAATLANGGINPFTGEKVFTPKTVQNVLSMMLTCGMYDYSGEFAFKIGIPAKSGVAGAIMIVIPNVMGIATWSPRLDDIGNSKRGIEFCKLFGSMFNFHIFDNLSDTTKINPIIDTYTTESIHQFSELCMAAQQGDLEYLKFLFNKEIDLNQCDYDGRTALHIAVCENNESIVKFLIQIGKVNQMKKDRWNHAAKDEAEKYHPHLLQYFE